MHYSTALGLAAMAIQPTFATVDFFIGELTWGQFGDGARRYPLLIFGGESSYPCDELDNHLLQNSNGGTGKGNFNCEGCSGGGPKDWDITQVEANAKNLDVDCETVVIKRDEGDWIIENGDNGDKIGDCKRIEGVWEKCTNVLDVYESFRFMRCWDIDTN